MSDEFADVETKIKLKLPSLYNVVFLNDDFTPMDFVVELLMKNFNRTYDDAVSLMKQIHEIGRGIAGTYSQEIAFQKMMDVRQIADNNGHPLRAIIEESI